ncbi:hypothetical protein PENSPDRAFT_220863 [Peniophora sp. CONT]|nr:hypothetical protein PENSPDRAFT_220863 [Peniophora sp. CONT]
MPPRGSPRGGRGGRGGPPGANNRGGGGTARGGGPGRAGSRRGGPPRGSTGGRGGASSGVGSRSGARGGVPAGGGSTLPPQQHSAILPVLVNHSLWNAHGQARLQQLNPDLAALGTTAERTRTTEALLKDVEALNLLASAFKSQVNRLAPISRLAPEILLRIFHLLMEMYRPGEGYRRVYGWIEVTRVCRSWRHLLLGEHTIWANNIGTIPGAYETFIERSGSHVPLHLYLEDELFEWPKYRPEWSALPLHRVHTLHCTISDQEYLE